MALTQSELERCKYELGFTLIGTAQPYIGDIVSIFETIIQPYLSSGAITTSSTTVAAATTPGPQTITLASATGFSTGCRVVLDVDERQESATVQSVTGSAISVLISKAHTGTYPVTVEGGESIVREILGHIRTVKAEMAQTFGVGSIKKVDEIEFYQTGGGRIFDNLGAQLGFWRDELASVLGIQSLWASRRGGSSIAVY